MLADVRMMEFFVRNLSSVHLASRPMLSQKPWRPEAVLLLGAGMLVIVSLTTISASLLQERGGAPQFVAFVVSTLVGQCLATVLVHFFLRYHRMKWSEFLGLYRRRVMLLMAVGITAAIMVMPLAWAASYMSSKLITTLHEEPKQQMVVEVLESAKQPGQQIIFALTAIIMAPLIEETMFRGILYPLLKQNGYPRLAMLGTSLLFAAIHMHLATFLPLFLFALVLILLYEWSDSLIVPITAHAAFNAINFALLLMQPMIDRWMAFHDRV
jgi:membrane protease YdiL (CAAX protease family)